MAGIYIHIPFCRRKCHYCNFFSLASQKQKDLFLPALKREIVLTTAYLRHEPVSTIYFGGGTPSVYRPGELQEMMDLLVTSPPDPSPERGGSFSLREITLELNPDDVTEEYVAALKDTCFNRFSLGIQSFSDEDLVYLNRSHSAGQALRAVNLLRQAGFENISIDLIYGIPSSTPGHWKKNLDTAFSLGVPHISAYALTVEPGTPLAWMIDKKRSNPVSDESQVVQFKMLMQEAEGNGFQQYEISNFSRPGWHAVHNTNYWNGVPYLGLGPSAHSYNGTSRRWNVSNLSKYIAGLENGIVPYEEEVLTATQKYNEYVMTSLRTMWGCDTKKIVADFGVAICDLFKENAFPMIGKGLLKEFSGIYSLTDEGKLFADKIASDLFLAG